MRGIQKTQAFSRLVAFDIETTGLSVERGHRIIEIGAVVIKDDGLGEEFHTLIFTDKPITKAAQKIHGIDSEMLVGQPEAREALSAFKRFTGTSTLIAHNASFDVAFLQRDFARSGLVFSGRHRCSLRMSRKLFPSLPNYRLETVARHLGIPVDEARRHRALEDARLTARVWMKMRRVRPCCAHSLSCHPGEGRDPEAVKGSVEIKL